MKKKLLIIVICHLSGFTVAQNWSVINSSDKFNFRLDGDNIITTTIWSDSAQVNAGDSVFFLNRIMCDTCATVIGGPNPCDTCYGLKNQPQFMQRKMVALPNGIVNFRDTANIVIHTLALPNDSWIFDSTQTISATMMSSGTDSIFGNLDSTKIILLSSGDTVKLSKSFGILQYPLRYGQNFYYQLVGIEGRNLGEKVPGFYEIFDFDTGAMFEYRGVRFIAHTCRGWPVDEFCNYVRKYSITNKQISNDTIRYQIAGAEYNHCMDIIIPGMYSNCVIAVNEDLIFVRDNKNMTEKHNHQYFYISDLPEFGYTACFPDSCLGKVSFSYDSNELFAKSYSEITGTNRRIVYHPLDPLSDTLNPLISSSYPVPELVYKSGLGRTNYFWSGCFEYVISAELFAYTRNNDTIGVFTPDSVFSIGIYENNFLNSVLIYPNPANEIIYIDVPYKTDAEINLTDLQGKTLLQKNINEVKNTFDVRNISNGFYFLTFTTAKERITRKIILQHH